MSLKCVTLADATPAAPFWFFYPSRFIPLSSASSDVISIYMASSTSLTDLNVWAEISYSDGTTPQLPRYLSTRNSNVLATSGTAIPTSTTGGTWTGASGLTLYQLDIDTSGVAGDDAVPTIRVFAAPSAAATIYFCPTVGLS